MRENKTIYRLILIFMEILLLYSPEFIFLPHYTWVLAVFGLIFVIYNSKFAYECGIFSNITYATFFMLLFNIVWSFIVTGLNNTFDYSYIIFLVGTLLTICRVFLLMYFIKKTAGKEETFTDVYLESLTCAGVVYVIFTLFFIIFPQFKHFWLTNVIQTEQRDYIAYQFRYSLNGFAAFASSTLSSFIVIITSYLVVNKVEQRRDWKKYLYIYIINIVGCFFYGRICIFAILLSIIYIIIRLGINPKIFKIIFIVMIILGILLVMVNHLSTVNENFRYWRDWSFAIIDEIISGKGITDHSVVHMKEDMYFMPNFKTLLIGDGKYTLETGGYYMSTDVGVMRGVLFFGILGVIVNYMMVLHVAKKIGSWTNNRNLKVMVFFICIMLVILELKGEAYQRGLQILLPIAYTLFNDYRKKQKILDVNYIK